MSRKAARRLRDKVEWLLQISKKQTVKYPSGSVSTNFRLAMITLTLPAKQAHSDAEIKKKCLNHFLVEMRKRYGMKHYVWKAELQENQNIHFHITTNTFVHHQSIRAMWNRILSKLGYVDEYQKKMSNLSRSDYHALRGCKSAKDFKKSNEAYDRGLREEWTNPNSTDVKTVFKVKNLAAYLAKYMAKSVAKADQSKEMQERLKAFGGRLWYCSQSLSRLKSYVTLRCNKAMDFVSELLGSIPHRCLEFDYCTCFYLDRSKAPPGANRELSKILCNYAALQLR